MKINRKYLIVWFAYVTFLHIAAQQKPIRRSSISAHRRCPSNNVDFYKEKWPIVSRRNENNMKTWWYQCRARAKAIQKYCRARPRHPVCPRSRRQDAGQPLHFKHVFGGKNFRTRAYDDCGNGRGEYLACSAMDTRWQLFRPMRVIKCFLTWNDTCRESVIEHYRLERPVFSPETTMCSPAKLARCVAPCAAIFRRAEKGVEAFWHRMGWEPEEVKPKDVERAYVSSAEDAARYFSEYGPGVPKDLREAVRCFYGETGGRNCSRLLCDQPAENSDPLSDEWHYQRDWQLYLGAGGRLLFRQCPKFPNECALRILPDRIYPIAAEANGTAAARKILKDWLLECEYYRWRPWSDEEVTGKCIVEVANSQQWTEHISLPCMLIKASNLRNDLWWLLRPHLADWLAGECVKHVGKWILEEHGHCTGYQIRQSLRNTPAHLYINEYNRHRVVLDTTPEEPICPYGRVRRG